MLLQTRSEGGSGGGRLWSNGVRTTGAVGAGMVAAMPRSSLAMGSDEGRWVLRNNKGG